MAAPRLLKEHNLVRLTAQDGFLVNALLITREYRHKEEVLGIPLLLQIHGLLGHFLARGPRNSAGGFVHRGPSGAGVDDQQFPFHQ